MKRSAVVACGVVCFAFVGSGIITACSSDDSAASGADGGVDASSGDVSLSSDTSTPTDAGPYVDAAAVIGIRFDNTECLPFALPTDDAGETTCRFAIAQPSGGCSAAGFSALDASDLALIEAKLGEEGASVPTGDICQIDQLAGSCASSESFGVCYLNGSCIPDAGCSQNVCTSEGFDAGASPYEAWMICP